MLLHKHPVSQFCFWMCGICRNNLSSGGSGNILPKIKRFLTAFTAISAKILRQIKVLKPVSSASSFQILYLLMNEFTLHEVELFINEESMKELMVNMVNSQATELSDSAFTDYLGSDFLSNPDLLQSHHEQFLSGDLSKETESAISRQQPKKMRILRDDPFYTESKRALKAIKDRKAETGNITSALFPWTPPPDSSQISYPPAEQAD